MGDVYNVRLKLKPKINEEGIIASIRKFIFEKESKGKADFRLNDFAAKGITLDNLEDAVKILITDVDFHTSTERGLKVYESSFNASYSWGNVMAEAFEAMAPFLKKGSFESFAQDSIYMGKCENGIVTWE